MKLYTLADLDRLAQAQYTAERGVKAARRAQHACPGDRTAALVTLAEAAEMQAAYRYIAADEAYRQYGAQTVFDTTDPTTPRQLSF